MSQLATNEMLLLSDNGKKIIGYKNPDGTESLFLPLSPSGGDDGPAIIAMSKTNRGRVYLGPGVFKINSPIILEGSVPWRDNAPTVFGPKLIGAGSGVTIIDTSGINPTLIKIHDTFIITGITNASPCVVTLSGSTPLPSGANWTTGETRIVNGTNVTLQTPSSSVSLTNSMESINGCCGLNSYAGFFIKKLTSTTMELYHDVALTVPLNTTDTTKFGTYGTGQTSITENGVTWDPTNSWKVRRYYGRFQYKPAIRIVGALVGGVGVERSQMMAPFVYGITFRGIPGGIHSNDEDLNGICLAFEDELSVLNDTKTVQGTHIQDVSFTGYNAAVLLDDATNNNFNNVEFQGNINAVFAGYNMDITSFTQCRFGEDSFVPGAPLQQVTRLAPVYIAPNNVTIPAGSQTNVLKFDSCWFMGINCLIGDIQPTTLSIDNNCYSEKTRTITRSACVNLSVKSMHIGNMNYQTNIKNDEVIFGPATNLIFEGNEGDAAPKFGWTTVIHNSGGEAACTKLKWFSNKLLVNDPTAGKQDKGHIKYNAFDGVTSLAPRYICLYDDTVGSEIRNGFGDYYFIGAMQVSGDSRTRYTAAQTGNMFPVPTQFTNEVATLTGNTNIWNPSASIDNASAVDYTADFNSGADHRLYRHIPLKFIFTQDATGGRTVTAGSLWNIGGYTNTGNVANAKTILEFVWDGAKFRIKQPNVWSV